LEPKSKVSQATVISHIEPYEKECIAVEVDTMDPDLFAQMHQWDKEHYVFIVSKSTTSTELAARTTLRPSMSLVPEKYRSHNKVFSKEASHRLSPHHPWDHAIDLIPGLTMKKTGIYRLMPKEAVVLKDYIMEHLQKGYICPLKSSMASPFFFIDKKDGKLQLVQDYQKLNEIMVCCTLASNSRPHRQTLWCTVFHEVRHTMGIQ
jgi:hypothetical protein